MSTDPALGPRVLFPGATLTAGFATIAITLAVALGDSVTLALFAGLLPATALLAAAYDYGDRDRLAVPDRRDEPLIEQGPADPNTATSSQDQ